MTKPSTPLVWASGKAFGFQPSAAQQAQGFDYIATVRPSTGAPITDDHDWPLNQVTSCLRWIMGVGSDGMLPKRSFSANDYIRIPDEPGGLIIQWGQAPCGNPTTTTSFPISFPSACLGVIHGGFQGSGNTQAYTVLNSSTNSSFTWSAFHGAGGTAPSLSAPAAVQVRYIAVGF